MFNYRVLGLPYPFYPVGVIAGDVRDPFATFVIIPAHIVGMHAAQKDLPL